MSTQQELQQQLLNKLQEAVAAGLFRVNRHGHFVANHLNCKTCGTELARNSSKNGTGPMGYCLRCRGNQIREGWRRRRVGILGDDKHST